MSVAPTVARALRIAQAAVQTNTPLPADPLAPYATVPRKDLLGRREKRLWLRLAQVAMPAGERTPAPTAETIERFDRFLAGALPAAVMFLRFAAWLFEWTAVFYRLYGSRFTKLDDARAFRYLDAWA